ncbi:MAG: hypothetical protein R3D83_07065 [Caenibius sp.]
MMTRNEIKDKRWTRPELTRLGTIREVAGGTRVGNEGNSNCTGGNQGNNLACPAS